MKWTDIPSGVRNAAEQRLWVALGDDADAIAKRINADPKFVEALAQFAKDNCFEPSTHQVLARSIMGKNFFGIEEAIKHFGVKPTKQQIAALSEVPFDAKVLTACKDTHVLVAVFPMSILDIGGLVNEKGLFCKQDWYNTQAFAKEKGEVGWQLVRKEPIADSTNKNWEEQRGILGEDEETPTAGGLVYTIIGHFLATGERLFENSYVRTSSLDSDGSHVRVGVFGARGLNVHNFFDYYRYSSIGLSGARKK